MHHSLRVRAGLWIAVGLFAAQAATAANPSPPPTANMAKPGGSGALVAVQKYAVAADNVVQDLRAGLRKLQRLCSQPAVPLGQAEPALTERSPLIEPWSQAQVPLERSRAQSTAILEKFERSSRISEARWCQLSPPWLPMCAGYREDRQLLDAASQTAQRLFAEASQRLEVYNAYAELEATRCISKGFTMRLWRTEEVYLWPLVTGAPDFFERTLRAR